MTEQTKTWSQNSERAVEKTTGTLQGHYVWRSSREIIVDIDCNSAGTILGLYRAVPHNVLLYVGGARAVSEVD